MPSFDGDWSTPGGLDEASPGFCDELELNPFDMESNLGGIVGCDIRLGIAGDGPAPGPDLGAMDISPLCGGGPRIEVCCGPVLCPPNPPGILSLFWPPIGLIPDGGSPKIPGWLLVPICGGHTG